MFHEKILKKEIKIVDSYVLFFFGVKKKVWGIVYFWFTTKNQREHLVEFNKRLKMSLGKGTLCLMCNCEEKCGDWGNI